MLSGCIPLARRSGASVFLGDENRYTDVAAYGTAANDVRLFAAGAHRAADFLCVLCMLGALCVEILLRSREKI